LNSAIEESQHSSFITSEPLSSTLKPSLLSEGLTQVCPDFETDWPENIVFEEWKAAIDQGERETLMKKLQRLVESHALAVSWMILKDRRMDIANAALEAVLRQIPKFQGKSKFSTWTESIMRNICNRELKKIIPRKNDVSLSGDGGPEVELEVKPHGDEVLSRLQFLEIKNRVDEDDQKLLQMKLDGFSMHEIGRELGLQECSARARWSRLRKRLREEMGT
jgi:RNA polymerase sigma factor (sigma-70 family)